MGTPWAISAKGLAVKAGRNVLLQPLNLSFAKSEFVGVLGPSGCGKTTLLNLMDRLADPASGVIMFDDIPIQ